MSHGINVAPGSLPRLTSVLPPPDLSVSIVTYNSEKWLPSLLASLRAQEGVNWELFVVDNASSDRTTELLAELPTAEIIRNQNNPGFGGAHNQNRNRFRGRYLLFLNPDLDLPPGLFQALVSYLDEHPTIAIAGPAVLEGPRRTPFPPRRFYPGESLIPLEPGLSRREPAWINGCCLAIRREVFEAAGGFDPDYFVYMEEVDLCWRVRRSGHRIGWLAEWQVIHQGRGSQTEVPEYQQARRLFSSAVLFWEKRYPPRDVAALLRFQIWGTSALLMLAGTGRGRLRDPRLAPARLQARRDECRAALARRGQSAWSVDLSSVRIALRLLRLLGEWIGRGGRLPLDDV